MAMRYSHVRTELRPWNDALAFQARRNVSWTRSSASWTEPLIR